MWEKVLIILILLSVLIISGCNKQTDTPECKEFRCYYSSTTGGTQLIHYPNLSCPIIYQEMDLFYVECKSR